MSRKWNDVMSALRKATCFLVRHPSYGSLKRTRWQSCATHVSWKGAFCGRPSGRAKAPRLARIGGLCDLAFFCIFLWFPWPYPFTRVWRGCKPIGSTRFVHLASTCVHIFDRVFQGYRAHGTCLACAVPSPACISLSFHVVLAAMRGY
ncbi:hypothetical protein BC827DRAFT_748895 [Russula dissimulans]|nr:hypothetical protein BC827DRAFT_748895 [Russula dissimulans]